MAFLITGLILMLVLFFLCIVWAIIELDMLRHDMMERERKRNNK